MIKGGVLVGWTEISAFARRSPRTLRYWVIRKKFPVYRYGGGKNVATTPRMIEDWMKAYGTLYEEERTHATMRRRKKSDEA